MQAIGRQPHRAPDGAPVHYEKRERDEIDRRTQNVRVTRKGEELVTSALGRLLQADREILKHLSEGERHMLLELLHKVARSRKR